MESFKTVPCSKIEGETAVPGDKSISHRSIIIGSLLEGNVEIENYLQSYDCRNTIEVYRRLGVTITEREDAITLEGRGLRGLREPTGVLDAGNSGTLLRLSLGLLAAGNFFAVITGDSSLNRRPMDRVIEPLQQMGAQVWSRDGDFAPVAIRGSRLHGIDYHLPVASAQVKSALLLAGTAARGRTTIHEPAVSRDHTERMLAYLGAPIEIKGRVISIRTGKLKAKPITIPGDFSSAAYLVAAALVVPGSSLIIRDVGVNPTRTGFLDVLEGMGADVRLINHRVTNLEPRADLVVESRKLRGIEVAGGMMGRLIDEIPLLAVLASLAEGQTVIRGAAELRVKETDRIEAMVANLQQLGVVVRELPDGMVIEGPARISGGKVKSFSDHRIAMAMVVAGLAAEGEVLIEDAGWVETSFPGFVTTINNLIANPAEQVRVRKFPRQFS